MNLTQACNVGRQTITLYATESLSCSCMYEKIKIKLLKLICGIRVHACVVIFFVKDLVLTFIPTGFYENRYLFWVKTLCFI